MAHMWTPMTTLREKLVKVSNILRDMAVFDSLPGGQAARQANALQIVVQIIDHYDLGDEEILSMQRKQMPVAEALMAMERAWRSLRDAERRNDTERISVATAEFSAACDVYDEARREAEKLPPTPDVIEDAVSEHLEQGGRL